METPLRVKKGLPEYGSIDDMKCEATRLQRRKRYGL